MWMGLLSFAWAQPSIVETAAPISPRKAHADFGVGASVGFPQTGLRIRTLATTPSRAVLGVDLDAYSIILFGGVSASAVVGIERDQAGMEAMRLYLRGGIGGAYTMDSAGLIRNVHGGGGAEWKVNPDVGLGLEAGALWPREQSFPLPYMHVVATLYAF